jgi:hypothetical protein
MNKCTRSSIKIGTKGDSGVKNLNPDCPQHGYNSPWYNSPEQIKRREERSNRLRELYAQRKQQ